MGVSSVISASLKEHQDVIAIIAESMQGRIDEFAKRLSKTLQSGGKLLVCGNGGSAADAQHFSAELVGRFETERRGLAAISLTTDTSCLSAIGNDYGFDQIYARQGEALATASDLLLGISTSGNSSNVLHAMLKAKEIGCQVLALTGKTGGTIAQEADLALIIPAERTARIQEAHATILHILCELIEANLAEKTGTTD